MTVLRIDSEGKLARTPRIVVSPKGERTVSGIVFASKREATRYRELLLLERCGDVSNIELQPRFDFPPGFTYVADFRYLERRDNGDPALVVEDVKGHETEVFKLKRKCMAHYYPDVVLRIMK